MSKIPELANMPEISFIENMTLQETESMVIEQYSRIYREMTGKDPELGAADAKSLIIKAFSLIEYQTMQYVEAKGRAELLQTSTGDALDRLADLLGIVRNGPTKATATERFTLSAARGEVVAVPAGTRVKTETGRFFNTMDYAEIPVGQLSVDVLVQAEEAGAESSGLLAGAINVLVDPIPYIERVENIDNSTGGLDTEDDDALTRRVYLAPSQFSCAGPKDAYEYWVSAWRGDVADKKIVQVSPCVLHIYFVINDPERGLRLPNETERNSLKEYINGETIRPMCDYIEVMAPQEVEYRISLTYWIAKSDQRSAGTIQGQIAAAVADYQTWQRKLGRDINPSELIARVRGAGAKRLTLTAPADLAVSETQLPSCTAVTVAYGGIEDD